jgi:hypothetical protein
MSSTTTTTITTTTLIIVMSPIFICLTPPTPSYCLLGAFQPFTIRAAPVLVFCLRLLHSVESAEAAEKLAASVFKVTK